MKVALVHDYLSEFGGAERVLEALCEIFPKAPIYTAFYVERSPAHKRFKNKKIITSWAQNVPFFASRLHSPLRFLAPLIWGSFTGRLSDYDLVITSSSWYVTKGIANSNPSSTESRRGRETQNAKRSPIEICYCHTPPRYLYGYPTAKKQKGFLVKAYALIVNHFMRLYDFEAAQRVDYFIANSREVASRIKKFYRRDSEVIYPPVDVERFAGKTTNAKRLTQKDKEALDISHSSLDDYFLVVSRLVSAKRVDLAVEVCAKLGLPLKVVGTGPEMENLKKLARKYSSSEWSESRSLSTLSSRPKGSRPASQAKRGEQARTIDFLGDASDQELAKLYQNCRAVIFPAEQEDFGIVPVEAQACGKPVIALAQGGILESVIDASAGHSTLRDKPSGSDSKSSAQVGQMKGRCTGVYFDPATSGSLTLAINNFIKLEKQGYFDSKFIQRHAKKFSKERFKKEILRFVVSKVK